MKYVVLPNDFTVLMLLTVSDIRDPINFSDLSDLDAILLVMATWIDVTVIKNGVKAKVIRPIFQQWYKAMIIATAVVVTLRQTTAMTPVIILCT